MSDQLDDRKHVEEVAREVLDYDLDYPILSARATTLANFVLADESAAQLAATHAAIRALPPLVVRCTEYLSVGGFFNPEMMNLPQANAAATRQLVLDVRDALARLLGEEKA